MIHKLLLLTLVNKVGGDIIFRNTIVDILSSHNVLYQLPAITTDECQLQIFGLISR